MPLPHRFTWTINKELRETLFWPCKSGEPKVVLLLIPGNPGVIDLYIEFATALHKRSDDMEIAAISHLGHTRFSDNNGKTIRNSKVYSLQEQVKGWIDAFDELDRMYGGAPKMFLCAHSVGSYIAEKIVESRADRVDRVFDLFPTVDHIADTPNGRKLQTLFRPGVRQMVSGLAELGSWILPNSVMQMMALRSGSLDTDNSSIIIDKMVNGSCINNVLKMAADEMTTILDVNEKLYGAMGDKFVMYYGKKDGWVPSDRYKKMCHINYKGNVVMCEKGISHAFVTTHPLETADVVAEFIRQAVNPKASESF